MQSAIRHQQFKAFRDFARGIGFGRIREADFRSRLTLDTDGVHEAAADVEWKASFLGDASTKPLALRTIEPSLASGQSMPNEYMVCIAGVSIVHNQHITTETDAELEELLGKLGSESVLEIKNGPETIVEKAAGRFLVGTPGVAVRQSTLAAGAATGVRGGLERMTEGADLSDPLVVLPGGSLAIRLIGQGAWTTTDDIPLDFVGHGWIAMTGNVDSASKVAYLNDLVREAAESPASLRLRLAR